MMFPCLLMSAFAGSYLLIFLWRKGNVYIENQTHLSDGSNIGRIKLKSVLDSANDHTCCMWPATVTEFQIVFCFEIHKSGCLPESRFDSKSMFCVGFDSLMNFFMHSSFGFSRVLFLKSKQKCRNEAYG